MKQASPYFAPPGDNAAAWQGGYPQQMQQAPFFGHQDPNSPYFAQPQMYNGMPSPPLVEHKNVPVPPMELDAEQPTHEMESVGVRSPPTPSPAYAEVARPK